MNTKDASPECMINLYLLVICKGHVSLGAFVEIFSKIKNNGGFTACKQTWQPPCFYFLF